MKINLQIETQEFNEWIERLKIKLVMYEKLA